MKKIKLVLVDIDGTLLNSEQKVTERTRQAISRLKDYGIQFGIATGRSPYAVQGLVEEWGIADSVDLVMGFNGSCYMDMHTQKMTSTYKLEGVGIEELLHDFKDFDCNAGIYDQRSFHAIKADELALRTAKMNHFTFVQDDLSSYKQSATNKVLLMADEKEIDRMIAHYNTLQPKHYRVFRSAAVLLECIHPELSKSKGIALMIASLGITKDEILTFGDMMNDYEMIRDYVGVAMGNADERVKQVAHYVTSSNDEDGIADFLEEKIFNEKRQL